jgi:hypothetical protein
LETADYIVEARVGVLGYDGHEITYGIPGSAALGTASLLVGNPLPAGAAPELSLGRRNHQSGAAKIGLFAYDRETREPVWQAGLSNGASQARDLWIFGMGPYQQKNEVRPKRKSGPLSLWKKDKPETAVNPVATYASPLVFQRAVEKSRPAEVDATAGEVATVSHDQPAAEPAQLTPSPGAQPVPGSNSSP